MAVSKSICVSSPKPTGKRFRDLTGLKYGHLAVDAYHGARRTASSVKHYWSCICRCGRAGVVISGANLKRPNATCGCRKNALSRQRLLRHGETTCARVSKEYGIWRNMLNRCRNESDLAYRDYGGRGIKVCRRWWKFENFLSDMGRCPPLRSLDRLDNDGPYSPQNCAWRTQKQQCRNRRSNRTITYNGETLCVAEWAERLGLEYGTLLFRVSNWPLEKVMTMPKLR